MANVNSLTVGNTTLPVVNSLASLSDTNIPANPAAGSLLTLQNGKWTPNTVEGAIGGTPALIGGGLQNASVGVNGAEGLQLNGAKPDGTQYAASFVNGQEISLYKAEPGQSFQKTLTIMPALTTTLTGLDTSQGGAVTANDTVLSAIGKFASDTGWLYAPSQYITGGIKYRKKDGVVFVDINSVISQEIPAGGAVIATLPDGFRPSVMVTFGVGSHTPQGGNDYRFGFGYILTDGTVTVGFKEPFPNNAGYPDGSVSFPVD